MNSLMWLALGRGVWWGWGMVGMGGVSGRLGRWHGLGRQLGRHGQLRSQSTSHVHPCTCNPGGTAPDTWKRSRSHSKPHSSSSHLHGQAAHSSNPTACAQRSGWTKVPRERQQRQRHSTSSGSGSAAAQEQGTRSTSTRQGGVPDPRTAWRAAGPPAQSRPGPAQSPQPPPRPAAGWPAPSP